MVMPASCLILFPYTTLFRSFLHREDADHAAGLVGGLHVDDPLATARRESIILQRSALAVAVFGDGQEDRKSTRLNSSHANISYAVFCLKKKKDNKAYNQ